MVLTQTPVCDFGQPAYDFLLPGIDGKHWSLQDCRGDNGTLVMFICNHCPYVKSIQERLVRDTRDLLDLGVKKMRVIGAKKRLLGLSGFGLEVEDYVSVE